ncbi:MAG: hypothetical protein R2735_01635 [Microthrixaceae bacterium]
MLQRPGLFETDIKRLIVGSRDNAGNWSSMSYDPNGNRTRKTDPLGRTTTATFNDISQPLTSTDAKGVTTTFTYDTNHNLISVSTPLLGSSPPQSRTVSYSYGDPSHPGDVTAVTDPLGKVTTFAYDADGNLISAIDPIGNETTWAYSSQGWLASMVSPLGNTAGGIPEDHETTFDHNAYGDVVTATDPLDAVSATAYDANRNRVSVTNPNGNDTDFVYDAEDRLVETIRADSSVVGTEYWPDGQVKTQIDAANNATSYEYDTLGRLASVNDPLSNRTGYFYDKAGNLVLVEQPGGDCAAVPATGCVSFGFDAAGQVVSTTYSDGVTPNISNVSYDNNGRRTRVDYGAVGAYSSWVYDSLGRLISSSDGLTVSYGYDLSGNVTELVYPGGRSVARGFDDLGRFISSTDWNALTTTFDYDADSNLSAINYPSGDQRDLFAYDYAGRVEQIDMTAGMTTLVSFAYGRDNNGQLTSEAVTGLGGIGSFYSYDVLERLEMLNSSPTWGFDAADNLARTSAGKHQAFDAAGQLCSSAPTVTTCATPAVGATTYGYDIRGNRTTISSAGSSPVSVLSYDQADRLTGINTADSTYRYNADGLRISKTVSGETTGFVWDHSAPTPQLLSESTDGDQIAQQAPNKSPTSPQACSQ